MIEVSWKKEENGVIPLSNLIAWLLSTIEALSKEEMHGFMVLQDFDTTRALLICEGKTQEQFMEYLKQPPEEYKERYIACVLSTEPDPVTEEKVEDTEDEKEDT